MQHDLELLAIVYALRVWRHYLIGWKFEHKKNGPLWFTTHFYAKRLEHATKALVRTS
jgi:hypothetical protein